MAKFLIVDWEDGTCDINLRNEVIIQDNNVMKQFGQKLYNGKIVSSRATRSEAKKELDERTIPMKAFEPAEGKRPRKKSSKLLELETTNSGSAIDVDDEQPSTSSNTTTTIAVTEKRTPIQTKTSKKAVTKKRTPVPTKSPKKAVTKKKQTVPTKSPILEKKTAGVASKKRKRPVNNDVEDNARNATLEKLARSVQFKRLGDELCTWNGPSTLSSTDSSSTTTTSAISTPLTFAISTTTTSAISTPPTFAISTQPTSAISTPPTSVIFTQPTSAISTQPTSVISTQPTSVISTPLTSAISTPPTSAISTQVTSAISTPRTSAISTQPTSATFTQLTSDISTPPKSDISTQPTSDISTQQTSVISTQPTSDISTPPTSAISTPPKSDISTQPTSDISTQQTSVISTQPTSDISTPPTSAISTPPTSDISTQQTSAISTQPTSATFTQLTSYNSTQPTSAFFTPLTSDISAPLDSTNSISTPTFSETTLTPDPSFSAHRLTATALDTLSSNNQFSFSNDPSPIQRPLPKNYRSDSAFHSFHPQAPTYPHTYDTYPPMDNSYTYHNTSFMGQLCSTPQEAHQQPLQVQVNQLHQICADLQRRVWSLENREFATKSHSQSNVNERSFPNEESRVPVHRNRSETDQLQSTSSTSSATCYTEEQLKMTYKAKDQYGKAAKKLARRLFTEEELRECTVKGTNKNKALDPARLQLIYNVLAETHKKTEDDIKKKIMEIRKTLN